MIGLIASLLLIVGGTCSANEEKTRRKIILFRDGTTRQMHRHVVERHGHKILHYLALFNAAAVALEGDTVEEALAAFQNDLDVAAIYPDHIIRSDRISPIVPVQAPAVEIFPWGIGQLGVPAVFELVASKSLSAPRVAIVDTGIDFTHPELRGRTVGGYNARAGERPSHYYDDNGHGTHMAGIIAAMWNGKGIIGVATAPELIAVKVLDETGHGHVSDLINGLHWVLQQRIQIVNMSLSFPEGSPLLAEVIEQLDAAGVLMVASAGNRCLGGSEDEGADEEGGDSGCAGSSMLVKYPAAYEPVIAVVATDIDHKLTDYNRQGLEVDLSAPGGDAPSGAILSTTPQGGYGLAYGSSQSAAHVSGAAAVALQLAPWLSAEQVVRLLKGTARDLGYEASQQGAGLVAVDNMVRRLFGLP
jgi:subtilisin family serine protease